MAALKIKEFPGLQRLAPETIEKHEMEQALRDAQYVLDVQLHDLRSEFLHREAQVAPRLSRTAWRKSPPPRDPSKRDGQALPGPTVSGHQVIRRMNQWLCTHYRRRSRRQSRSLSATNLKPSYAGKSRTLRPSGKPPFAPTGSGSLKGRSPRCWQ